MFVWLTVNENESGIIYVIDDGVINFKIYLQSTSKAMVDREKKRGRQKYKNLNMSRTKRAF